jgi:hypothetical protein
MVWIVIFVGDDGVERVGLFCTECAAGQGVAWGFGLPSGLACFKCKKLLGRDG